MSIRAMTALAAAILLRTGRHRHAPKERGTLLQSCDDYCFHRCVPKVLPSSGKDLVRCTGRTSCEA